MDLSTLNTELRSWYNNWVTLQLNAKPYCPIFRKLPPELATAQGLKANLFDRSALSAKYLENYNNIPRKGEFATIQLQIDTIKSIEKSNIQRYKSMMDYKRDALANRNTRLVAAINLPQGLMQKLAATTPITPTQGNR